MKPGRGRKNRNRAYADGADVRDNHDGVKSGGRYWNEYDHPEQEADDANAYFIYINPDEPLWWPGRSSYMYLKSKVSSLFQQKDSSAEYLAADPERGLLIPHGSVRKPQTSDDSSSSDDSDEDTLMSPLHKKHNSRSRKAHDDYGTLPPPAIAPYATNPPSSSILLSLSTISLTAALSVLVVVSLLASVGRHKAREEVDVGILFGVVASLAFVLVGVTGLVREGASVGRIRWTFCAGLTLICCVGCGALLNSVIRGIGSGK